MKTVLSAHQKFLRALKKEKRLILAVQIGILAVFIGFWEVGTRIGLLDSFLVSSPSRIVKTVVSLAKADLWQHIGATLTECVLGFAISTALGTAIAVVLWASERARRIFEPYIVVLNSLPKVALSPLIIIWAGIGMRSIIIMSVLISIIITIISMQSSFISASADKILLMRSMGANKFQILFKLIIPYSLPDLISVLKINVGLAWVGTIMGEYMNSRKGLGNLINYGASKFNHDLVMACTVLLCLLAATMYLIVAFVEKCVKKER